MDPRRRREGQVWSLRWDDRTRLPHHVADHPAVRRDTRRPGREDGRQLRDWRRSGSPARFEWAAGSASMPASNLCGRLPATACRPNLTSPSRWMARTSLRASRRLFTATIDTAIKPSTHRRLVDTARVRCLYAFMAPNAGVLRGRGAQPESSPDAVGNWAAIAAIAVLAPPRDQPPSAGRTTPVT